MITVFGSINVDLVCRVADVPKAGQTVMGSDYELIAGGKGANQALAARRAGAQVRMVGAVGDDAMAGTALAELRAAGVDLASVAVRGDRTGVAIITVDRAGENAIVVAPGANARAEATAIPGFGEGGGTLLLQLEVPFAHVTAAAEAARAAGLQTILSIAPFAPLNPKQLEPFTTIVVNEHEAADLAASLGVSSVDPAQTVTTLAARLGRTVIATLGPDGAVAAGPDGLVKVPAIEVEVVDTTGAGDTFAGTLAAFLDEGLGFETAMRLAAVAGSLACTRAGAQPSFPTRQEIDAAANA